MTDEEIIKQQMEAARPDFESEKFQLFPELVGFQSKAKVLDFTKPYKKPPCVLNINGIECLTLGDIHGITGQAGAGKTKLVSMICASVLSGECGCMYYCLPDVEEPRVLVVDSEQSEADAIAEKNRVQDLMGWPRDDNKGAFHILQLGEIDDVRMRRMEVFNAICDYKPTVAIVDGLIDLVRDINDFGECTDLVYKLMKLARVQNVCIMGVLHQNPTTSKTFLEKMAGQLGSVFQRKVRDLFEVIYDEKENNYAVKAIKNRGHKRIEEWRFVMQNDLPVATYTRPAGATAGAAAVERFQPKDIAKWLFDFQDTIKWPATTREACKLFKAAGMEDETDQRECVKKAKNLTYLKELPLEEGQARKRLELNRVHILEKPATTPENSPQLPTDATLPFKPADGTPPPF